MVRRRVAPPGRAANGAGGGGKATADKPAITTAGAGGGVDLSHFAAVLNARRSTPTTRVEPPDPGYEETLPFKAASSGDDPAVGEPIEQGSGGGLGQRLIADPEARRRSLGFVAFGLLLFVLGMTGLFVKGEVNRADELEALDGDSAAATIRSPADRWTRLPSRQTPCRLPPSWRRPWRSSWPPRSRCRWPPVSP